MRSRSVKGVVLATMAACVLSSCSAHPGAAAVVGSETISDSRLEDVASAFCSLARSSPQSQQQGGQDSRTAREQALGVLIDDSLSHQYADSQGAEPDQEQVSAFLARSKATLDTLPASQRSVFRDTLTEFVEGQLSLIEVGTRALAKRGTAKPSQQRALAAGTRLRTAWAAKNADVSVDPRYGSYSKGVLQPTSGSLSVPRSTNAVVGARPTPGATWVASLPASQKCG